MAQCKICSHEQKRDIDRHLLVHGQVVKVAREHGLCVGTVWNHFKKHLPWRRQRRPKSVTVAEQLEDLKFELSRLQVLGECGEKVSGAIHALRERRQVLELEARLEHRLGATHKKLFPPAPPEGDDFEVVFEGGRPRGVRVEKAK